MAYVSIFSSYFVYLVKIFNLICGKRANDYFYTKRSLVIRLDQTLGKPGAWIANGSNSGSRDKQNSTVVARLARVETQVCLGR